MTENKTDGYDDWCIHYRGLLNDPCNAGVHFGTVALLQSDPSKSERFGLAKRLPCFKSHGITTCPSQRFNTPEEAAAKRAETDAAIAEWVKKLSEGICPDCDRQIDRKVQIGRCVYAEPCGHRLYQGRA